MQGKAEISSSANCRFSMFQFHSDARERNIVLDPSSKINLFQFHSDARESVSKFKTMLNNPSFNSILMQGKVLGLIE